MGNRKKKKDKKKALKHRFAKNEPPTHARSTDDPSARPLILFEPAGEAKMSDVLMDFIEPYEDYWETQEELGKLLGFAVIAWNVAIEPERAEELVKRTIDTLPPGTREDFLRVVGALVERKQKFFARNTRIILDYKLTPLPDGSPYLSVISTLPV